MTNTFTGVIAWDVIGASVQVAANMRSISIADPVTHTTPTSLQQAGVPVSSITTDSHGGYTFTCDAPSVVINFGAGTFSLYSAEVQASLVGVTAQLATKADKISLPINPKDAAYGAVGDGTTDDTAAIQSALTAAASAGRSVTFPDGTYIVSKQAGQDYMLAVAAGQVLTGARKATIKVKSGAGDYRALITGATPLTDLTGLDIHGLTFDLNNTGNPVTSTSTLFAGYPRYAVFVPIGNDVNVHHNVFRDIDSTNTVSIAGPTVTNARVQDNTFTGVGTSPANHDHSTIYIAASGMTIAGNVFLGVLGGKGATTAIETHGSQQVVNANRVSSYYAGMNITGVSAAGSDNVAVTSNVLRDVLIGIDLWSYSDGTGLRNLTVTGNNMTIERDSWLRGTTDFARGIMLDPSASQNYENLKITSNTIVYNAFTAPAQAGELQAAGIALWINNAAIEVRNLDVFDNTVVGALSAGIRLQATTRRAKIARNRLVDCGSSTEAAMASFYKSGITIVGDMTDVVVDGNTTFDTRATHKLAQGVMTSISAVVRGAHRNNTVACTDGTFLAAFVQTAGKLFDTPPDYVIALRFLSSQYYGPEGARSVVTTVTGTAMAVPFWVAYAQTWDRIGCEVTVAGAAGSLVRLAIYADSGSGVPGALVLDAGTVTGDTAAAKEIAISQPLVGGLYWLASVGQVGTPQIRSLATNNILGGAGVSTLGAATGSLPQMGYTMNSVTGAFPTTWAVAGQSALPGLVVLRAA